MTTSENERQRVVQQVTKNGNDWQQGVILANFILFIFFLLFFWIREKSTTTHPKENSLKPEENLEDELLN